jgi:2-polyprenyl-3-methyl-5-hydroxy-6-metoxy-1,4-benzoquinol methylase
MRDFSKRCTEREIMDDPLISEKELNEALVDIAFVNKWLGGNAITVKAVRQLLEQYPDKQQWSIADVGCGDGEMLRLLAEKLRIEGLTFTFTGIDINEKGLERARLLSNSSKPITYINKDIHTIMTEIPAYDIVISTLTLHHIKEVQIIDFLKAMTAISGYAVIINDLDRSKIAYGLFKVFSRIFIKSRVAKNDGLVSIASAFKRKDLERYSKELAASKHKITWKWAFRYLWCITTR